MDLLFILAHWHGLAKLRLHTDDTLHHLDKLTSDLGNQFRTFQAKTCSAYKTQELPRETRARDRLQASKKNKTTGGKNMTTGGKNKSTGASRKKPFQPKSDPKSKDFSLHTYKNHALGDYVDMIIKYGTVDSYSTESVSPF